MPRGPVCHEPVVHHRLDVTIPVCHKRVRVRNTAGYLCVTIPVCHKRVRVRNTAGYLCVTIPVCYKRVRVRNTAGYLCVTIPICHSRELYVMHRDRVTARPFCDMWSMVISAL